MKVFISWSGARSQVLAQGLRDWMPLVLHYVEPWLSEADVAAGERWAQAVAKELETSNFGIICVTRENVASPWILFEAGSLAKSLQGSGVIPLLLDLEFSEISGPLAQFQAKKVDKNGLSEVIQSINQASSEPIPEARTKQLFEALWPELEKQLALIPKQAASPKPVRLQHEILEELVAGVRSLESRRFRPRLHPFVLHDLAQMVAEKPGDPIAILVMVSLVREAMPWLYELGMEAYRAVKAGAREEAQIALRRFQRAADFMWHGPFVEEFGLDPRAFQMIARELEQFLLQDTSADEGTRTRPRRRKEGKED